MKLASLSLDLDNKWSYMKTHGDAGWQLFPTYLDAIVPRALDFLSKRNLKITFFVVGQDAALPENHQALSSIAGAGHEIGNHSFKHEPWLHLYSKEEIETELERAENALQAATGHKPVGFRGPGFSLSAQVVEILAERGYEYDCSTFPTYLAPLARAYYFATAKNLSRAERAQRNQLFGKFTDGFQPLKPYVWQTGERGLIEIPVTTLPLVKSPIHFSYLLYLACFSELAAKMYFRTVLATCAASGVEPSLLLHPLDFLDGTDAPELRFFPAMNLASTRKIALLDDFVEMLQRRFQIVEMRAHAAAVRAIESLPVRALRPSVA